MSMGLTLSTNTGNRLENSCSRGKTTIDGSKSQVRNAPISKIRESTSTETTAIFGATQEVLVLRATPDLTHSQSQNPKQ